MAENQNPLIPDFETSFSPPLNSSSPSFFDDYTTSFDLGFDTSDLGYEDPDCFFCSAHEADDDVDEQMNFVTDLFEPHVTSGWESDPVDSDLQFGFGPGLRVVDIDSDSDSDDFSVNLGLFPNFPQFRVPNINNNNNNNNEEFEREEFEWEEVVSNNNYNNNYNNLNSVIHRIEEISVSSNRVDSILGEDEDDEIIENENENEEDEEYDEEEEEVDNVEWEVLLAVNSLERSFELDNPEDNNTSVTNNNPEDLILSMEYDALFGQLVENENAVKGSPPAAKSAVEGLGLVVLTKEDVGEGCVVVCAVCKDEVPVGEKMTRMPCCHLYHGECILPWLTIRNTCPVCRFELPTDDAEYEKRRRRVGSGGRLAGDEFEVTYNFELLP